MLPPPAWARLIDRRPAFCAVKPIQYWLGDKRRLRDQIVVTLGDLNRLPRAFNNLIHVSLL